MKMRERTLNDVTILDLEGSFLPNLNSAIQSPASQDRLL
jgi:hypothetical protein